MATLKKASTKAVSDAKMDRRGPFNPNRQRQPVRVDKMASQFRSVKSRLSPIKGPDQGMG